jgi:ribosomal protein L34E
MLKKKKTTTTNDPNNVKSHFERKYSGINPGKQCLKTIPSVRRGRERRCVKGGRNAERKWDIGRICG